MVSGKKLKNWQVTIDLTGAEVLVNKISSQHQIL